ncbi:hypothetical protein ABHD31_03695 [Enterobacter cloacae]|uniref:hypothetical protein n=1 Tax=Enterobacter cloacae TaxID=550 RepID=UPI00325B1681|nr:hypothetical protein [Enterobacter cloacae]HBB9952830.1 hypothetical protein [Enterobacter cloacae]
MMTKAYYWLIILAFVMVFSYITIDVYTINTVDYYRVINTFIDISQKPFKPFDPSMTLSAPFKEKFDNIDSIPYASSFTYLVYIYALIASKLTNTFSLIELSFIWKGLFVCSIIYLVRCIGLFGKSLFITSFLSIALLSSTSNLAFFESLYQESVWLYCLPVISGYLIKKDKTPFDHMVFSLSLLIGACSKSQFFYIPTIFTFVFLLFKKFDGKYYVLISCVITQCLSIYCIGMSEKATNYNKYHAAYLGAYAIASSNGIKLDGVDTDCIGVDSWGNKYDASLGAVATKIGRKCYERNRHITFKDSLSVYLKHPFLLLNIPFDFGVLDQFKYNYFHVYKRIKLSHGGNHFSDTIDSVKDLIPGILKVAIPLLLTIFVIFKLRDLAAAFIFLSILFYSQIYISFLGEGYRDLSKHLFLSNLCFDIMVVLLVIYSIKLMKKAPK